MSDYRLTAIKEFLKTLLSDSRCLSVDDNLIYCEKLFFVNGVMKWLYNKLLSDEIDIDVMKDYLLLINEYLDNRIELFWKNGNLSYNIITKETY